jgi:Holliday junction DNA helicase RuvB
LTTLIGKFDGGPVGVESLAAALGEEADTLESVYEPYLLQEGYLQRTSRGRMATTAAYALLHLEPQGRAKAQGQQQPLALDPPSAP